MALISCPECGKQISDKAVSCPGCGCPMSDIMAMIKDNDKSDLDRLVDKIWLDNPTAKVRAVKLLREKTGLDLKTAKNIMDNKYGSREGRQAVQEQRNREKEERREEKIRLDAQMSHNLNTISNAFGSNKPKKGVAYESKKLSVGRAAVGYGLAGPAGAVLGGLSSKKRQAVDPETGKKLSKREIKKRMK